MINAPIRLPLYRFPGTSEVIVNLLKVCSVERISDSNLSTSFPLYKITLDKDNTIFAPSNPKNPDTCEVYVNIEDFIIKWSIVSSQELAISGYNSV